LNHLSSPQLENFPRPFRYFDLIMTAFVAVLIASNIASSAKIVNWGISLFGVPLAFDAGTLLFPVSYIFGDILTEVYGYRRSRRVIWTGFAILAITSLFFAFVSAMPGEAAWEEYAGQAAYDSILGGFSSGAIVVASLVAFFAGEFSNSFILAKMKLLTGGKHLW
jgi:queuosine precursor transporter